MLPLNDVIRTIIHLRQSGQVQLTLLAACPNSEAVLEAAVKTAALNRAPMLFAATLNQVDLDGGYTGWTPASFVEQIRSFGQKYDWYGPLYPCLDHGGPWLKDRDTLNRLSFEETMSNVKRTLEACLEAGYQLLHIDPTVDRSLPVGEAVPVEVVVRRTVELISHAEHYRQERGLPPVAYEVGTEEVHGGLVEFRRFEQFLGELHMGLQAAHLEQAWPCFVVAQVGTDLHTTYFDAQAAQKLYETLAPLGSLVKGHYSDWVENPEDYPATGMGGANVGPEFTAAEYLALRDLVSKETALCRTQPDLGRSGFMEALEQAVLDSGRWKKWLQPEEKGLAFRDLAPERREWLVQTGARYIWTQPAVKEARQRLYQNLQGMMLDPHQVVIDRIVGAMDRYINAFGLFNAVRYF
jgi:tagatose-1,6-bisphosphate aldolase non-catalytic subunit AgaZ/GatZ